jgi:hypothetical protein
MVFSEMRPLILPELRPSRMDFAPLFPVALYSNHRTHRIEHSLIGGLKLPRTFFCIAITVMLASSLSAPAQTQTQPSLPDSPSQPSQTGSENKSGKNADGSDIKKQQDSGTSKDRLFYALPNFLTVETSNVPPLTAGQKFKVVTQSSFDYIQIPWYAFLAGISQAEDSEPGYGQGAEGYGKRFGAAFADGTIENYMTGAILPSLLHQDPRFFQSGKGGFLHRTGYAMSRIIITRGDSGSRQFNFSEVVGSAMSASISTYSYHPKADRTLSNTASVWGSQLGYDTITIVIKEFWPDIRRKLQKK